MWPPARSSSSYAAPSAAASVRARSQVTSVSVEQPTTRAGMPASRMRAHSRRRSRRRDACGERRGRRAARARPRARGGRPAADSRRDDLAQKSARLVRIGFSQRQASRARRARGARRAPAAPPRRGSRTPPPSSGRRAAPGRGVAAPRRATADIRGARPREAAKLGGSTAAQLAGSPGFVERRGGAQPRTKAHTGPSGQALPRTPFKPFTRLRRRCGRARGTRSIPATRP